MTHGELTDKAARWLKRHRENITVPNCPIIAKDLVSLNGTGEVPDVLGFNYSRSVMIEVKVSRADFLRDKKKQFRNGNDTGELKFYCCPAGLIKPDEVPEKWGLLYADEALRIRIEKKAERQQCNHYTERAILCSIIRRQKDGNRH